MRKRWLCLFSVLLFLPIANAVGIGSNNDPVPIVPNSVQELKFYLINNKEEPVKVQLSVSGTMAPYIALKEETVTLTKKGEIHEVFATVFFPEAMGDIGETLLIATEENQVQKNQINVRVHSAARVNFQFPGAEKKEPVYTFQELPAQQQQPNPDIEVGDYFIMNTDLLKHVFTSKMTLLLLGIVLLIVLFDVQTYVQKRKLQKELFRQIMKK